MRALLVRLHRWLGLASAGFLLLAGASGAIIAWDHELDGWLNPAFYYAPQAGSASAPLTLKHQLEASEPHLQVRYMPLQLAPGESLSLFVEPRIDPVTGQTPNLSFNQLAIDPTNGNIIGQRLWGEPRLRKENLLPFIYRLHYSLQLPVLGGIDIGRWLLGLVAIGWCIDCLVALWLSFPDWRQWRKSLAFRWQAGGYRLLFDLHRSGGVWIWLLLLMLALTSISMNLEQQVMRPLVSWFSPLSPAVNALGRKHAASEPVLSDQQLISLATREARRRGISAPAAALYLAREQNMAGIGFFAHGEQERGLGAPWFYLDNRSGEVLSATIPGQGSRGDRFMQWMFPLHSGRIAGVAGRVLISLAGVLVGMLSITGILIWLKKYRARRQQKRRATAPSLAKETP